MDLKETLMSLEDQVSLIKDPVLKKAAFEKLLDKIVNVNKKDKVGSTKRSKRTNTEHKKKKPASKGTRLGPKAMLAQLLDQGFFDKPRLVMDIPAYIKHKTGHVYSQDELSISLTRMLRGSLLIREKTEKGPYEWKKA